MTAAELVASTHRCAEAVVVVGPRLDAVTAGTALARATDGVLLVAGPDTAETIERLGPDHVVVLDLDDATLRGLLDASGDDARSVLGLPAATDLVRLGDDGEHTDGGTPEPASHPAVVVADHLGVETFVVSSAEDVEAVVSASATPAAGAVPMVLADGAAPPTLPAGSTVWVIGSDRARTQALEARLVDADLAADARATVPWPIGTGGRVWLVDPADTLGAVLAAATAAGAGDRVLPMDAGDVRAGREHTARLRAAAPERTVLVGLHEPDHAGWQLRTVLDGHELPGGGFHLFEDTRMVALYGSPQTAALGLLGEQAVGPAVERARQVAQAYGADGRRVLPAFEIIATVASAGAGPTGDYSRRTPIEVLRPWVDAARDEGLYVILDLQPGRTDFLEQAREYEELLREPHVGLALDPEWRLGPDQLHLRQIGSVAATEVQQVADWLAALTREHLLPQKLLVLHQFRLSMLPDRDTIVAPPELAVVVHMDGQGSLGAKHQTYGVVTQDARDRWHWGWKNFIDEDAPMATPDQVLALDPPVVLVTYQ